MNVVMKKLSVAETNVFQFCFKYKIMDVDVHTTKNDSNRCRLLSFFFPRG